MYGTILLLNHAIILCCRLLVRSKFSLKDGHSITMCSVMLREVDHTCIELNSNIYCCSSDVCNAYDKSNTNITCKIR